MLWVDTYLNGDEAKKEEVDGIIDAFRPFWESESIKKVWHNYSFDRHVMERLGLKMNGFDGDTMHMARLWDSSRLVRGGYSLEALSSDENLMGTTALGDVRGKVSMKKLFGKPNLKKDGTEGKLTVLPPVHELQRGEDTYWSWVNYSAYDAKSTWDLHAALESELRAEPAKLDADVAAAYARSGVVIETLWDLYRATWRPFGGLLTDMEAAGMAVDRAHLAEAQERAVREEEDAKMRFRDWATSKVADAAYMNVGSGPQVSQLLFGGVDNRWNDKPGVPLERIFKVPNQLPSEEGKKPKKNMDITLHNIWGKIQKSPLIPDMYTPSGIPACSTPVLKTLAGKPGRARKALADIGAANEAAHGAAGLEALRDDFDDDGSTPWSTDDAEIAKLQMERQEALRERTPKEMAEIGEKNGYGKLFQYFPTVPEGLAACAAVDSLIDASTIDTLLSNFIIPLQSDDISKPDPFGVYRVHCSLNINTETGRLSARRPNLQNQPALEKDRYRVRKAFTADRKAGKTLIVADYGQLELRILAHMANCQSMLTAFKLGGDFHSRTALGMYDYIQDAIAKGDCLLEWDGVAEDGSYTPPPVPLLKDLYGAERRRAKVLNFSIAYGKTAHGLSKDWGVSLKEAGETVEKWYSDRKEVEAWQKEQRYLAEHEGYVCTILGRRRQLPDAKSGNKAAKAHALRAAINTPIQGSAADVATAAMLRITADERLREMGWRLLLQVHDEVILEGPKETAEIAQAVVVECMRSPFGDAGGDPLRVELAVDSKYADTWYDAK
jgi:DNA polymerase-1